MILSKPNKTLKGVADIISTVKKSTKDVWYNKPAGLG